MEISLCDIALNPAEGVGTKAGGSVGEETLTIDELIWEVVGTLVGI